MGDRAKDRASGGSRSGRRSSGGAPGRRAVPPDSPRPTGPPREPVRRPAPEAGRPSDPFARSRPSAWRARRGPPKRGDDPSASTIRAEAIRALLDADAGTFAADALDESLEAGLLGDPRDRALLREIVLGTLRWRRALDAVFRAFSTRPPHAVEPAAVAAVRIGLYQAFFLDRVPEHAAVHETVSAVRAFAPNAVGFVNACLRAATAAARAATADEAALAPPERVVGAGERRFVLDRDVFESRERDLGRHLADRLSCPAFLVRRWLARFGAETTEAALVAGNARPALHLRVNRLRATVDDAVSRLRGEGVEASPTDPPGALVAAHAADALRTRAFAEGIVQAQDASAQRAAILLDPPRGARVLDLCAAPGGKATQLAEIQGDSGEIVAVDRDPARLRRVEENAARLGTRSVRPVLWRGDGGPPVEGDFPSILLDAPCSNTGVLARRPEARWRFQERALAALVTTQERLLRVALRLLDRGGALVYSVCSIEPEEGADRIRAALRARPELHLEAESLILPATPMHDGAYLARLRRP